MSALELTFLSSLAVIVITIAYAYISEFGVGEKGGQRAKRR